MQWIVHLVDGDGSELDVTVEADTKVSARDAVLSYYPMAVLTPLTVPPPSPEPEVEDVADEGLTAAEALAIAGQPSLGEKAP